VSSLPIGIGWRFAAERPVLPENAGASDTDPRNRTSGESETLAGKVRRLVESLGWYVCAIQGHPYQGQFQLKGPDGTELKLFVSYNQGHEVTGMRVSDPSAGHALLLTLAESAAMNAIPDTSGQRIARSLQARVASKQLRVVGFRRDGEYRLSAVLAGDDDGRAQIEINHSKEGVVSTVRPIKFFGSGICDDARSALSGSEEGG
jgi:hypothetical protein